MHWKSRGVVHLSNTPNGPVVHWHYFDFYNSYRSRHRFFIFQNVRPFYALGLLKEVKPNIPNGRWGYWEMWSYKGMTQNQGNEQCTTHGLSSET